MILTNIHNQVVENNTKAYLRKVIIIYVAGFIGMPNIFYFFFNFMCHFIKLVKVIGHLC